ncbi:MAG TPA: bifunctional phosphoribosylaminoimidazolecarboxamide formyltransferase/IMP cyclohydrolase [Candidatus Paceibacterota bacterium]|nr:bifunctional phosphoribosylaminoimidazolecarboxamide formyltransferase/IMP cyclohydrolase [Candidatus Paceibacterota bacterium]
MQEMPEELVLRLKLAQKLRYGENPHQSGALYVNEDDMRPGVARAKQVQGKELSFNNLADADAAFECVAEFEDPAVVIVKHMNPCGVATGESLEEAYLKALACDPVSAFGGIVAANSTLNEAVASELVKLFLEVVIAPAADEDALGILSVKPNLRLLLTGEMPDKKADGMLVRSIAGGYVVQSRDNVNVDSNNKPKVVSKRQPTAAEWSDMKFAFEVVKHVKSNAIVYAKDGATIGIGAGQMSRIHSAKIAAVKAAEAKLSLEGSVMASDAFFPFPDCVEAAAEAGATAIVQPGGSKNDQASIDAADKAGMAMVFTGVRHFRH